MLSKKLNYKLVHFSLTINISVVSYLLNSDYFEEKKVEELSLNNKLQYEEKGVKGSKKDGNKIKSK